jgi:hypothetical protein
MCFHLVVGSASSGTPRRIIPSATASGVPSSLVARTCPEAFRARNHQMGPFLLRYRTRCRCLLINNSQACFKLVQAHRALEFTAGSQPPGYLSMEYANHVSKSPQPSPTGLLALQPFCMPPGVFICRALQKTPQHSYLLEQLTP